MEQLEAQLKRYEASQFSTRFIELWSNKRRSLDISQYEECLNEWVDGHERRCAKYMIIAILLFVAGLWATYNRNIFLAVLLLALASISERKSSNHLMLSEMMGIQRLMAMLINKG